MNSQKEWQHTQDLQVQTGQNARPEKGKQTQVIRLTKELLIVDTFWERNTHFPHWSVTGYMSYPPGQTPCPRVVGKYKTSSMSFCLYFLFSFAILFCLALLVSFTFFFVVFCFNFHLLFLAFL